ncbi:MAG: transglutaminase family protein [Acidimicrobiales bacterium]
MSLAESKVLRIRHVTGFSYLGNAESSYNEARMTPQQSPHQSVVEATLAITPVAVQSTYRDYFDTIVTTFDLHEPHERLEVVAEATVHTFVDARDGHDVTVKSLREPRAVERFAEFLAPTTRTSMAPEVLEDLRSSTGDGADVHATARDVVARVQDHVDYVRGSTQVSSTAQEVWEQGAGVCQDLTHVTISMLRSLGIPARYVSGYFHSNPDATVGEEILGESHAWVEYFADGWSGIDPTNASSIGTNHVIVAKGREYGDVPPLKGIYHGGPSSALGVVVHITRVA